MRLKTAVLLGSIAALFALMSVPATFAYTGTLTCYSPASCSGGSIAANGPGSTVNALYFLQTTAPSGTTMDYFVCVHPTSAISCTSNSGGPTTDSAGNPTNGWSFTMTATGTTSSGSGCIGSCEGNTFGTPSTLTLSVTAPTVVTSSNSQISLDIYACDVESGTPSCATTLATVASASVTATVPEFGLGIGAAVAIGLVGFVLIRQRVKPAYEAQVGTTL